MTRDSAGGFAALVCALTYIVGFALRVTVLAPLGYGTDAVDAVAVTTFATILPPLGDAAGAIFGLGAIGWFLAIGMAVLGPTSAPIRA
ncbi:hypothetical protein [uncultured Jannaschia sp.]|uniref:hypothetical protein n=1 Tax=uncultured Jannaschia sp. TaxID=293347 RepID=UPI0026139FC4|nr:hypothetical protein [uncultured Jannaschia sp.]